MSNITSQNPSWATSSYGHPADISPLESSALGDHLSQCDSQRGALQAIQSGADELRDVLVERVVTSAVVIVLLVGGSLLMI